MEPINTVLVTQARTGSTRLPGKVLLKVNDKELLKIHLNRLSSCKMIDHIVVATTTNVEDDQIAKLCQQWNFQSYKGSENDVLDRFYQCTKDLKPKWVVRVTSDCPLIDPELVDAVISCAKTNNVDYCSNGLIENFPDGQDVEVFKFSALEKAWGNAKLNSEREHVTPYIRMNANFNGGSQFTAVNFPCVKDYSKIRMTVDERKDFDLIKVLIEKLGTNETWTNYVDYIIENQLYTINMDIIRNEGYLKSLKND